MSISYEFDHDVTTVFGTSTDPEFVSERLMGLGEHAPEIGVCTRGNTIT